MKLEIHFEQRLISGETDVYITKIDESGKMSIAKPMELVFDPYKEVAEKIPPSLHFDRIEGAQFFPALVDALARVGYRYESSDAGELKAMKEHLKDMRQLVFDFAKTVRGAG